MECLHSYSSRGGRETKRANCVGLQNWQERANLTQTLYESTCLSEVNEPTLKRLPVITQTTQRYTRNSYIHDTGHILTN